MRRQLLISLLWLSFYLLTRLLYLTKIPIFTDEAIYIRWGQIALQDPAHRFISLEDGKQPLFIWLMLPFLAVIPDPLVAGRLVSVLAGMTTLIGVTLLARRLFSPRIGWITAALYVISPFFVLYDRLALYDSLTTALTVWSLFLGVLLAQLVRLDIALLLGLTIGAGLLTKSSAQFSLMMLPLALLLFNWREKNLPRRLAIWSLLAALVVMLSQVIKFIIKLSPLSHMVGLKNLEFIVSLREFFEHPLSRFWGNLGGLINWSTAYLTVPLLLLLAVGGGFGLRRWPRRTLFLLAAFALPFFSLAAFGKVLYPRFLLFMLAPLLPIIALGIDGVVSRIHRLIIVVIAVMLIYPLIFSYLIIFNPLSAPLPHADRFQLLDDWPSGYGINEVITFFRRQARTGEIFVGTEGTFGLTPAALEIYLHDEPNIQIKGYWPISDGIAELIQIANTHKPTYLLLKDTQAPKPEWPVTEVARFRKGTSEIYSILLQVIPTSNEAG